MIQQIFIEVFTTIFFGIFIYFYTSWGLMYPGVVKYIKKHRFLHPNSITVSRIFFAVFAFYLYYKGYYFPATVVYMCAIVTDAVDGMVARACKLTSELGKSLDPLVDKIVYFLPLVYFGIKGELALELVLVFIFIDTIGQFSRVVLKYFQLPVQANIFGKIKTTLVFVFIYYLMIFERRFLEIIPPDTNQIMMLIIILFAFLSILFKFISFADIFGIQKAPQK